MKSSVIRTAIGSSVITAVLVSALGLWAVPKFVNPQTAQVAQAAQADDTVRQPAVDDRPSAANPDRPVPSSRPRVRHSATPIYNDRVYNDRAYDDQAYNDQVARDPYGEPIHHYRSREKSALIVAGSAGTGAAIGAIAGGGKGAAIGAISGGAAGFIYDRITANK